MSKDKMSVSKWLSDTPEEERKKARAYVGERVTKTSGGCWDWNLSQNGKGWYLSRLQWRLAEAERLLNTRPAQVGADAVREALPERPITSLAYSAKLSPDQVRTVQRIVKEMDAYADALEAALNANRPDDGGTNG